MGKDKDGKKGFLGNFFSRKKGEKRASISDMPEATPSSDREVNQSYLEGAKGYSGREETPITSQRGATSQYGGVPGMPKEQMQNHPGFSDKHGAKMEVDANELPSIPEELKAPKRARSDANAAKPDALVAKENLIKSMAQNIPSKPLPTTPAPKPPKSHAEQFGKLPTAPSQGASSSTEHGVQYQAFPHGAHSERVSHSARIDSATTQYAAMPVGKDAERAGLKSPKPESRRSSRADQYKPFAPSHDGGSSRGK